MKGLQPAIDEFLAEHAGEWRLVRQYTNNNGLTVLGRVEGSEVSEEPGAPSAGAVAAAGAAAAAAAATEDGGGEMDFEQTAGQDWGPGLAEGAEGEDPDADPGGGWLEGGGRDEGGALGEGLGAAGAGWAGAGSAAVTEGTAGAAGGEVGREGVPEDDVVEVEEW